MKSRHELYVCKDFLEFYNMKNNTQYSILRHGEQGHINEPDCVCSDGLNIEIVGVYYGNPDAKLEWRLARKEITVQQSNESQPTYINPDQLVFTFLEEEWGKKERKLADGKYCCTGKIFLLIDARNTALTQFDDYVEYFKKRTPATSHFDEVWLRAFVSGRSQNNFLRIFQK